MDRKTVGGHLAARRKAAGLTQEALGERLGVTNKTVSRWETGAALLDTERLQTLAALYGVSVDALLSGEGLSEKSADPFTLEERQAFWKRQWFFENKSWVFLCAAIVLLIFGAGIFFKKPLLTGLSPLLALCSYGYFHNSLCAFVEKNAYKD